MLTIAVKEHQHIGTQFISLLEGCIHGYALPPIDLMAHHQSACCLGHLCRPISGAIIHYQELVWDIGRHQCGLNLLKHQADTRFLIVRRHNDSHRIGLWHLCQSTPST